MSRRPRRRVRQIIAATVVSAVLLSAAGAAIAWFVVPVDTVGRVSFDRELAIPPLATSSVDDQGRRVFNLTAQARRSDLGGGTTDTWAFNDGASNGDYLGPTLRASRGEQVVVEVGNDLPEPTTVHWHGMDLPPRMDGGPHQMVEPGEVWKPSWEVDQPAATLWYHPHPHGETETHVRRGLAGMFIVDDPIEAALDLPREYGVDDVPVIVQDINLGGNGQLRNTQHGSSLVVNGTPGPYLPVSTELVRLRLLNASTTRVYEFGLDDDSSFTQIASDGGLLPAPHETERIRLSPGERAEIVVAMQAGEHRVVRSYPPDLGVNVISSRFDGGADKFDVLQLRAAAQLDPSPPLPASLAPDVAEHVGEETDAVGVRSFELQGRSINGAAMDMNRVDEVVTLGDTEVWEVINDSGSPHNFHVHGTQFRVLTVNHRAPGPELSGLKDTVYLPPNVPFRLLVTFADHADPAVPYMYHCHLLRHEDQGMMGQFLVVEEGTEVEHRLPDLHDGHGGHH